MGPSWRNANLICQQEDKYFKTKHMLLRQLASNTLKMLLKKVHRLRIVQNYK